MESFLRSCAEQARTGIGAHHESLSADVRRHTPISSSDLVAKLLHGTVIVSRKRSCQCRCKACNCCCVSEWHPCFDPCYTAIRSPWISMSCRRHDLPCRPAVIPPRSQQRRLKRRTSWQACSHAQHVLASSLRSSTWRRCAACCKRSCNATCWPSAMPVCGGSTAAIGRACLCPSAPPANVR